MASARAARCSAARSAMLRASGSSAARAVTTGARAVSRARSAGWVQTSPIRASRSWPAAWMHGPVDYLGATHAVFPAQRGADGGAADPVGAALVAEQEPVAARPGRALPVPAGRHRAGAGDDDHTRGAEEGAGPGAVRVAGDVHRAARLPGQRLAEVAGLAGLAHPRHADARGGRVRGLDDLPELRRETVGEQRVHRRPVRAGGDRAVLQQDDPGAAAAGVDAEDPAGQARQGAVPCGGAWLAHGLTLDATDIRFVRSVHGSAANSARGLAAAHRGVARSGAGTKRRGHRRRGRRDHDDDPGWAARVRVRRRSLAGPGQRDAPAGREHEGGAAAVERRAHLADRRGGRREAGEPGRLLRGAHRRPGLGAGRPVLGDLEFGPEHAGRRARAGGQAAWRHRGRAGVQGTLRHRLGRARPAQAAGDRRLPAGQRRLLRRRGAGYRRASPSGWPRRPPSSARRSSTRSGPKRASGWRRGDTCPRSGAAPTADRSSGFRGAAVTDRRAAGGGCGGPAWPGRRRRSVPGPPWCRAGPAGPA